MKNRLAVAGLCFTLTAGMLTGCSGNSGKAIITLDGQKTEYAVANIMLRYSQAQMQAFYGAYLGDNLWSQYGDSTKSTMMDTLKQMLILEQHQDEYNVSLTDDDKKKIDEAAQQFMDDNDQATLKPWVRQKNVWHVFWNCTRSAIKCQMRSLQMLIPT